MPGDDNQQQPNQQQPENQAPAQNQQNLNPDYAGYQSLDQLVAGYRASGEEAKKWRDEALQLREERQQWGAANQRQSVPDRADPSSTLQEYGVPVEALDQFVASRLSQAFEPFARGVKARNEVLTDYPDYNKFEADVAQFLQQDPARQDKYQRMFQSDPAGAMEWAFLKFGESRRGPTPAPIENGEDRSAASLPNAREGDSRSPESAQQQDLARAYEHYQKTGNAEPYARLRLRSSIPSQHYEEGGIPGL